MKVAPASSLAWGAEASLVFVGIASATAPARAWRLFKGAVGGGVTLLDRLPSSTKPDEFRRPQGRQGGREE
jgi:hypothetical protein